MVKKKKYIEKDSSLNVGRTMTVSLFLILLTFFILLNSFATMDDRKIRMAWGSMVGAFGSFLGGLSPMKTGDDISLPAAPIEKKKLGLQALMEIMDKKILSEIKIESGKGREIITITEKVLFDKGGSKLKSSAYPFLNKLGDFIKKGEYPVEIVGHTDNRPAGEKGYKSNWELSTLMAIHVLEYFVEKGKVPPGRITAYGAGSNAPIGPNATRQSRTRNRRVDIIFNYNMPAYISRIYKKPGGIFTYKRFNFRVFQ